MQLGRGQFALRPEQLFQPLLLDLLIRTLRAAAEPGPELAGFLFSPNRVL